MQLKTVLFSFIALTAITFTSCKKESVPENNTTPDSGTELNTHSDDQGMFSKGVDDVANDANTAIESFQHFSGKLSKAANICDATIDVDTMSNPRTITITYLGTNCLGNHTRTGKVILAMAAGVQWKNAGASFTITFFNLKITRVSDNKSIILNGTQTVTNVTGGRLWELPTLGTITHTLGSTNMQIKFMDSTSRNWSIAKQRTYTYNNGIVFSSTGTHTDGTITNIAEWGTNRFGHPFKTVVNHPIIIRQDCNFRVTAGQISHLGMAASAVLTFGLDANGNPTGCPGSGHYYFKIVVTGPNGVSQTAIHPY